MTISRRTFLSSLAALAACAGIGIPVPRASAGRNFRIVNAWDPDLIWKYMSSAEGEEIIMSTIRRRGTEK